MFSSPYPMILMIIYIGPIQNDIRPLLSELHSFSTASHRHPWLPPVSARAVTSSRERESFQENNGNVQITKDKRKEIQETKQADNTGSDWDLRAQHSCDHIRSHSIPACLDQSINCLAQRCAWPSFNTSIHSLLCNPLHFTEILHRFFMYVHMMFHMYVHMMFHMYVHMFVSSCHILPYLVISYQSFLFEFFRHLETMQL